MLMKKKLIESTVMVNQRGVTTSHLKPLTTEHTKIPRHMALGMTSNH